MIRGVDAGWKPVSTAGSHRRAQRAVGAARNVLPGSNAHRYLRSCRLSKTSISDEDNSVEEKKPRIVSDPVVADWWARVQAFSLDNANSAEPYSFVLKDEMSWTEEFTQLAILEYKKFMLLSRLYPDNMTPSVHVDTTWHLHLLYTKNYQSFCRDALDTEFLHHEPSGGGTSDEAAHINWYAETLICYMDTFGNVPPPEIWGQRVRTDVAKK